MPPDPPSDAVDKTFYAQVGERIRKARKELGLTQDALGNAVGLTRTSITNVEKGRQKLLLYTFARLGAVLKKPPAELLPPPVMSDLTTARLPENLEPTEAAFVKKTMSAISKGKK